MKNNTIRHPTISQPLISTHPITISFNLHIKLIVTQRTDSDLERTCKLNIQGITLMILKTLTLQETHSATCIIATARIEKVKKNTGFNMTHKFLQTCENFKASIDYAI